MACQSRTWQQFQSKLGTYTPGNRGRRNRRLPNTGIVDLDSFEDFLVGKHDLDGMLITAEEDAPWNVLHSEVAVVVPKPVMTRPVAMVARASDPEWLRFLDGWVEFKRIDESLEGLRDYGITGTQGEPHWDVVRNELHWVP